MHSRSLRGSQPNSHSISGVLLISFGPGILLVRHNSAFTRRLETLNTPCWQMSSFSQRGIGRRWQHELAHCLPVVIFNAHGRSWIIRYRKSLASESVIASAISSSIPLLQQPEPYPWVHCIVSFIRQLSIVCPLILWHFSLQAADAHSPSTKKQYIILSRQHWTEYTTHILRRPCSGSSKSTIMSRL